jgi:hypothetical protein
MIRGLIFMHEKRGQRSSDIKKDKKCAISPKIYPLHEKRGQRSSDKKKRQKVRHFAKDISLDSCMKNAVNGAPDKKKDKKCAFFAKDKPICLLESSVSYFLLFLIIFESSCFTELFCQL